MWQFAMRLMDLEWLNTYGLSGVQSWFYWSSTPYWNVVMYDDGGVLCWNDPSEVGYAWPVRGGQFGASDPLYVSNIWKTGMTQSQHSGDDGALQRGVSWPSPRFHDNSNGTVSDNLTSLIWLKNAECFGQVSWSQALTDSNALAHGQCGLTDGSSAGNWRLPNQVELESLIDFKYLDPAISNTMGNGQWTQGDPFTDVAPHYYWTSTTVSGSPDHVWVIGMGDGVISGGGNKAVDYSFVWPVRDGQGILPAPSAPSNFTAKATSSSKVLGWKDNSNNEQALR